MFWLLHQVIQHAPPPQKKISLLIIDPYNNTSLSNSLEKRKISLLHFMSECLPYSYNSKLAKMKKAYLTFDIECLAF